MIPRNSPKLDLNRPNLLDIKADLFSILQTARYLMMSSQKGNIDYEFYFKRMGYFHKEILQIEENLKLFGRDVLSTIQNFDSSGNLMEILKEISSIQDYEFERDSRKWQLDPFQLSGSATEITSNFITLLDYLHLIENFELDFFNDLILTLIQSLQQLEIYQPFLSEILRIYDHIQTEIKQDMIKNQQNIPNPRSQYYPVSENILLEAKEKFSQLFTEFQNYMQIGKKF
jgi:hypothetical protein